MYPLLNRHKNKSSKQFTELKNIENWASYGKQSSYSLNKFQLPSSVKSQYFSILKIDLNS